MAVDNIINKIHCGDSAEFLKKIPANIIDLTVTSPPYDNARNYKGYSFDFPAIAQELYRVTKEGGVVVWVVNDLVIDGSKTLTSFRQAIQFVDVCKFNMHDVMIWEKINSIPQPHVKRYEQRMEYMFVLSKGMPSTFNPITEKRKWTDRRLQKSFHRNKDGKAKIAEHINKPEFTKVGNVWAYCVGGGHVTKDKIAYKGLRVT